MPFSPELTALCQTQLNVLMQFGGSAQGIVYLSETGEDLCPVAVYPSVPAVNLLNHQFLFASDREQDRDDLQRSLAALSVSRADSPSLALPPAPSEQELVYQVVFPLQEDRYVLGALVVSRGDRDWRSNEYQWLEQVAQTLTWAGLMDRRLQWLQTQLQAQEAESRRQEGTLETLLHQIRNPLTALKTFGKLLLRRLPMQDQNRPVAEGIVRESDRLQFLLQELRSQVQPLSVLSLQGGSLQDGSLQDGSLQDGSLQDGNDRSPLALPGSLLESSPQLPTVLSWKKTATLPDSALNSVISPVLSPVLGSVALERVLEPLITAAQAIAEDRDLHFSYTGLTIAPPVQASLNTLRETLSNLVDNALKYTPKGGAVQVQWLRPAKQPGWQWVVVSDNGPGIPATDLPHLFERHYRGVQAQGEIPGTGIGLALAYGWMEQMGGRLEVISPAGVWRPVGDGGVGVGFRLWLPEAKNEP